MLEAALVCFHKCDGGRVQWPLAEEEHDDACMTAFRRDDERSVLHASVISPGLLDRAAARFLVWEIGSVG